jgi:hypothetical protein
MRFIPAGEILGATTRVRTLTIAGAHGLPDVGKAGFQMRADLPKVSNQAGQTVGGGGLTT